ncbi:MAG TPA: hypothetical protein VN915_08365 [Elusimicrobiota bacterium]|nr:hypothetical protein [Elusimicrobiota bacterium]
MAPLERSALLAALLLAPAAVGAQSDAETQARDGMAALKAKYAAAGAQRPSDAAAAPAQAAVDPAKLRASHEVIQKAGIPITTLIDASPDGMNWTPANVADLGPVITAASRAVGELHARYPSEVSGTFYGNGTMVNLEESIGAATHLWPSNDFQRGCVAHQNTTLNAVVPVARVTSLEVHGVFVVRKVTGHHAVIVFPKGTDWKKTGVVLDGWIHQESAPDRMTFLFKDWYGLTSWKVALE